MKAKKIVLVLLMLTGLTAGAMEETRENQEEQKTDVTWDIFQSPESADELLEMFGYAKGETEQILEEYYRMDLQQWLDKASGRPE